MESTAPVSYRGYLSIDELEEYADIDVSDTVGMLNKIAQAEELIDAWAGFQEKYICGDITGKVSSGISTSSFVLDANYLSNYTLVNYFSGCIVEFLSGSCAGQRRVIRSSSVDGIISCDAFTTTPSVGSFYKIYQVGKFPTLCDVSEYGIVSPPEIYKSIPENVKRAVCAQVQFMLEMGDDYFSGDSTDKSSESIGDYSYQKGGSSSDVQGIANLIAPKAKVYMRGIRSIGGGY